MNDEISFKHPIPDFVNNSMFILKFESDIVWFCLIITNFEIWPFTVIFLTPIEIWHLNKVQIKLPKFIKPMISPFRSIP